MNSYSYSIVEENDQHLLIDDFLRKNEDLHKYFNKIIEAREQGRKFYEKVNNAIKDISFEKILENSNNTLIARVYYDMPDNIDWITKYCMSINFYYAIWTSNKNFTNFIQSLPISINEWGKHAKEVLEDPEVLKIFIKMEEELELERNIAKLQEIVDNEEVVETIVDRLNEILTKRINGK